MPDINEYMNQTDYAKRAGVSRERVRQLCALGRIASVKLGHTVLIHKDALIEPVTKPRDYPLKRVYWHLDAAVYNELKQTRRETNIHMAQIVDIAVRKYLEMDE